MLKNFTLFLTIATVFSTTLGMIPQYASAEAPKRPQNAVTSTSPQEQALLDALSKTPGYTPAVGQYVKEFKKVHGMAKTQAQHKAAQEALVRKYPNEAKFFQAFMQRVVNLQQQANVQRVLQAIQRDGKMTPKFKQFMNELSTSVRNSRTMQEAKAAQQRVIGRYPAEAKLVVDYTNKMRK